MSMTDLYTKKKRIDKKFSVFEIAGDHESLIGFMQYYRHNKI